MSLRVHAIVTRPQPQADGWVAALKGAGVDASAFPLIDISAHAAHSALAAALEAAWARASTCHALMFVSAAAVVHFFAARPVADTPASFSTTPPDLWRAWATGPGTAAALRAAGVPEARIDQPPLDATQFDSESLWQWVKGQCDAPDFKPDASLDTHPKRVLIVRGGNALGEMAGRDWLAQQLQARGVAVEFAVAYTRHAPVWTVDFRERFSYILRQSLLQYGEQTINTEIAESGLKDDSLRSVWVFSSSEAIENLRQGVPQADWRGALAVATHPRIAQTAEAAGFGRVLNCGGSLDAVIASIKSLE